SIGPNPLTPTLSLAGEGVTPCRVERPCAPTVSISKRYVRTYSMNSIDLSQQRPDVLIVGAGNAALCAAISAHENGARVLTLEAAPFEERGGNSHFTGGAFRFAYRGVEDLITVLPSLASEDLSNVDFGTYTEEQFFDDMFEVTEYRTDSELCEIL